MPTSPTATPIQARLLVSMIFINELPAKALQLEITVCA
jgi:hypothetical protein